MPRPVYSYQIIKSNTTASIVLNVTHPLPYQVTMWYAYTLSAKQRDFRLLVCADIPECLRPVIWWAQSVPEETPGSGIYVAKVLF